MTRSSASSNLRDPLPGHDTVAVLGLGRSGLAAARLLAGTFGKRVIASDSRETLDRDALAAQLPDGVEIVLGRNALDGVQVAVVSPGIEPDADIVAEAAERGVELLAEIEIGGRACTRSTIAITGTDGKTTTTMLIEHLLRHAGYDAPACGNIGTPFCEMLLDQPDADLYVVEISAFQLWNSPTFAPTVLVTTNIADDHLDYFAGDRERYVATKRRPLASMGPDAHVVLNAADPEIATWTRHTTSRVVRYGTTDDLDAHVDEARGRITIALHDGELDLDVDDLLLRGRHNWLNVMAAALGASAMGAPARAIGEALRTFRAPAHRIETVGAHQNDDGQMVTWIDDSKATNAHAAMAGLAAVEAPVVLIAGGVDKQLDLSAWIEAMRGPVVAAIVIGDLAQRLAAEIQAAGLEVALVHAGSMSSAVRHARELADEHCACTVLLSPGCSSFDMFSSYADRGEQFQKAARALPDFIAQPAQSH